MNQLYSICFLIIGSSAFAQGMKTENDTLRTHDIEDVKFHKTGNPNKARFNTDKSALTTMENPQSVAIISHEIIEQQQAQQVSDIVKNVNGVYITSSRGSTQDSFGARGYTFGSENIFKNGSRVNSGTFPEVSGLERVEVLKGSAAILYGNVAAGGVVNMITKKPLFNAGGTVGLSAGNWNNFKPTIDLYGPLSSKTAFRINGTLESKDSFRDLVESEKYYVNPSFLVNFSDKSQLILEADYLNHHFTPDFGLGTLVDAATGTSQLETGLKRSDFVGASWQYSDSEMATSTATFNHLINDNWHFNTVAAFQNYTRDYYSTERVQWSMQNRNWKRPLNKIYNEQNYGSLQMNLNGQIQTGNIQHKLLVGIDGDYSKADTYAFNNPKFYGTNGDIGGIIYLDRPETWISGAIPDAEKTTVNIVPTQRFGVYAQNLVDFGQIKFLGGLRYSYLELKNSTTKNFADGSERENLNGSIDRVISPRAGIVYQPQENLSYFASYSNSLAPNSGFDIYKNPLKPSISDQFELGLKKNLWKNTIALNLTAYQIDNRNTYQTAQFKADGSLNTDSTIKEFAGKMRNRGVELDLTGNPTPFLSLIGGVSYNHSIYTETPEDFGYVEGQRLVRTPATTANASVFYTFQNYMKGLTLGTTAFYTGNRLAGWNDTKNQTQVTRIIEMDGFTTLDISAAYKWKKINIQGKLANIFDEIDYNVHENYSVNPIMPRNFYLTLTYSL